MYATKKHGNYAGKAHPSSKAPLYSKKENQIALELIVIWKASWPQEIVNEYYVECQPLKH